MSSSPSPYVHTFGRAIRKRRRERDLSQQALAARAGMSFRHLGEIERGNRDPRVSTVRKLVDALELSPHERARFFEEAFGDGDGDAWPGR